MSMQPRSYRPIAAAILALLSHHAMASTEDELADGLINAMRLKAGTIERVGNSGKAIQAYMREGFVGRRPNRRDGYTDYYLLKRPARLMGHELVLIEEEYQVEFIGCCVNDGVGVTLRVDGSTEDVEAFAEQNGCRVETEVDFQEKIARGGIKAKVAKGNYLSLSCRVNDTNP
jgi:hypothetical protein